MQRRPRPSQHKIAAERLSNYPAGPVDPQQRATEAENRDTLARFLEARRQRLNIPGDMDLTALRQGRPAGRHGYGGRA